MNRFPDGLCHTPLGSELNWRRRLPYTEHHVTVHVNITHYGRYRLWRAILWHCHYIYNSTGRSEVAKPVRSRIDTVEIDCMSRANSTLPDRLHAVVPWPLSELRRNWPTESTQRFPGCVIRGLSVCACPIEMVKVGLPCLISGPQTDDGVFAQTGNWTGTIGSPLTQYCDTDWAVAKDRSASLTLILLPSSRIANCSESSAANRSISSSL